MRSEASRCLSAPFARSVRRSRRVLRGSADALHGLVHLCQGIASAISEETRYHRDETRVIGPARRAGGRRIAGCRSCGAVDVPVTPIAASAPDVALSNAVVRDELSEPAEAKSVGRLPRGEPNMKEQEPSGARAVSIPLPNDPMSVLSVEPVPLPADIVSLDEALGLSGGVPDPSGCMTHWRCPTDRTTCWGKAENRSRQGRTLASSGRTDPIAPAYGSRPTVPDGSARSAYGLGIFSVENVGA